MNHCVEPEEPEFDLNQCPAIGVGGRHSEQYCDDGHWRCEWCGARPFWPVQACDEPVDPGWWGNWPHLCYPLGSRESIEAAR